MRTWLPQPPWGWRDCEHEIFCKFTYFIKFQVEKLFLQIDPLVYFKRGSSQALLNPISVGVMHNPCASCISEEITCKPCTTLISKRVTHNPYAISFCYSWTVTIDAEFFVAFEPISSIRSTFALHLTFRFAFSWI